MFRKKCQYPAKTKVILRRIVVLDIAERQTFVVFVWCLGKEVYFLRAFIQRYPHNIIIIAITTREAEYTFLFLNILLTKHGKEWNKKGVTQDGIHVILSRKYYILYGQNIIFSHDIVVVVMFWGYNRTIRWKRVKEIGWETKKIFGIRKPPPSPPHHHNHCWLYNTVPCPCYYYC